jgi:hypothetical protein
MTTTAFAQTATNQPLPSSLTRIHFVPGTSAYAFTTNLAPGVVQGYVLGISAGQTIFITKSGNASVQVLDPGGNVVGAPTTQVGPWGVGATQSGDYTLVLNGQGYVTVSIYVPPVGTSQQFSTILPYYQQRIRFVRGATGYTFTDDFSQGMPRAFVLGISAGQQLNVTTQGNLTAAVIGLDGNPLPAASLQYGQWQYSIPRTGDYRLVLVGTGRDLISINIPPLPGSSVQRVYFARGADSITLTPTLTANTPQSYILGVSAGQTMYLATQNISSVSVFDPQGNTVAGVVQPGATTYGLMQNGDYTVQVAGQGQAGLTITIPPLPGQY